MQSAMFDPHCVHDVSSSDNIYHGNIIIIPHRLPLLMNYNYL